MQQPPYFQAQQGQPGVYVQQPPQPTYIIQNVPPPQDGCCSERSEKYNTAVGVGTGITQLVIGILCVIMSVASYAVSSAMHTPQVISAGVIFYMPTGILGIFSKNKSKGVITGYLVMGILSALQALVMLVLEALWALSSISDLKASAAIHVVLAILAIIEFVVSIVGAVYCCVGLQCCCASLTPPTAAIHYQQQVDVVTEPYSQGKM